MGSVLDTFDCPVCGGEATRDFYYKSGEEFSYCPHCGYQEQYYFPDDSNGQLSHSKLMTPFAAFRVCFKEATGSACGSYQSQEEQIQHHEHLIAQGDKVQTYAISRFADGKVTETVLINNP